MLDIEMTKEGTGIIHEMLKKYVRKIKIYYLTFHYVNVNFYNDEARYTLYVHFSLHYI